DARQHGLDQTVLVVEIKTANDHEGACEGNQPQPKAPFLPLDTVRVAAVKLAKCSTGSEIVKGKIHRGSENICMTVSRSLVDPRGSEFTTWFSDVARHSARHQ